MTATKHKNVGVFLSRRTTEPQARETFENILNDTNMILDQLWVCKTLGKLRVANQTEHIQTFNLWNQDQGSWTVNVTLAQKLEVSDLCIICLIVPREEHYT